MLHRTPYSKIALPKWEEVSDGRRRLGFRLGPKNVGWSMAKTQSMTHRFQTGKKLALGTRSRPAEF